MDGLSHAQALLYARELRDALRREQERTRELEQHVAELGEARAQITEYAEAFKASLDVQRAQGLELRRSYLATIHVLAAAVEARDPYTGGHIDRVTQYSLLIARQLGWDEARLRDVEMGAALHDIGKIGVRDTVLGKPGPFSEEDWQQMRRHPEVGVRIVSGVGFLARVTPYVLYHHERFDGSGYPLGCRGADIPIEGRLVAVADAFDAMTTDRPYRAAYDPDIARRRIVAGAGSHFDPEIAAAFEAAWPTMLGACRPVPPATRPADRRAISAV